jgi:hypothetical protein
MLENQRLNDLVTSLRLELLEERGKSEMFKILKERAESKILTKRGTKENRSNSIVNSKN